jgi:hypothetical protein
MQADGFLCAITSSKNKKKKGKEEITGEVYYSKQSIFNATRQKGGTITLHRFSWSKKENEPAPNIRFNYGRQNNHYIPTWAASIDRDLPGSATVSLCSTKNMTNIPKDKPTSSSIFDFITERDILPEDFQSLLLVGLYVVVPDLLIEVSEYLECCTSDLTKAIRIRRASHHRGYTLDVDLRSLCNTLMKNIVGTSFPTSHQSKLSALIKILVAVKVDGRAPWSDKFFIGRVKGFLLLHPGSACGLACGSFCVVTAFIYIDSNNGSVKCSLLDKKGNHAATIFGSSQ